MQNRNRENWIDAIKVFACILVAAGHFFQSMVSSGVLAESGLYRWFNQSIYAFHVPLFFICSGYLYQKGKHANGLAERGRNILKKALALGVPYFAFSFATWALKMLFSGEVNTQASGLLHTLFLEPLSPYWYLYCLFLLFVLIPVFRSAKGACIGLAAALAVKIAACFWDCENYALSVVMQNAVWFVSGMCLCSFRLAAAVQSRRACLAALATWIVFVVCGIVHKDSWSDAESFLLGILACFGSLAMIGHVVQGSGRLAKAAEFLGRYTMPVFLMHTIFAAALRSVLFKIGVENAGVHVAAGLAVSFIGPMIAAEIMARIRYLDFFLYPGKYIRIR